MKSLRDQAKSQHSSKLSSYGGKSTGTRFSDKGSWGDSAAPVDSGQDARKPPGADDAKPVRAAKDGGAIKRLDRKPRAAGGRVARAEGGKMPSADEVAKSMSRTGDAKVSESQKLPAPLEAAKSEERLGNMRVTRKAGGKVHSDVAEDKKLIKGMVKPECRTKRADGGGIFDDEPKAAKKGDKKGTVVNIVIGGNPMDKGPDAAALKPPMPPMMPPAPPPMMPPPPPGGGLGAMGAPPMGPGGAGGIGAPPMMRKAGGRVDSDVVVKKPGKTSDGYPKMDFGSLGGKGRRQKILAQD